MKKVLVTGGSGFIGRQAVRFLQQRGFEVLAPSSTEMNVLDPEAVTAYVSMNKPTHALHCAWIATPGVYQESPDNQRWVDSSMHFFRELIGSGAKRIVGVGTCFEYTWPETPCVEDETPTDAATTFYGRCKNECRKQLMELAADKGISAAWGRVFYLYGPNEPEKKLVASVINSLLKNEDVACTHGRQVRDFSYVEDIGDALACLVDSDIRGPVNVASGEATSLKDLLTIPARQLGNPEKLKFGAREAPPNEPPVIAADISKLTSTGWVRRHSHEEGMRKAIEWWKDALKS